MTPETRAHAAPQSLCAPFAGQRIGSLVASRVRRFIVYQAAISPRADNDVSGRSESIVGIHLRSRAPDEPEAFDSKVTSR